MLFYKTCTLENMSNFHIRRATAEDAEGVKAVHITGWREAYHQVLPADFLDQLDSHIDVERWRRTLADHNTTAFVATTTTNNPQIVGWLTAGTAQEVVDAPTQLELQGLYITAQWYGSGVAHALVTAGIGNQDAYLWVLKDNPRAQAFYRKEGFDLDGAEKFMSLGPAEVEIARMTRIREEP